MDDGRRHSFVHALLAVKRKRSFFVHHTQQLAAAAQVGDAKAIRRKITQLKVKHIKARFEKGEREG